MSNGLDYELRERSGTIMDNRPLVSFFYELLRDGSIPIGEIEMMVRNSLPAKHTIYTNGYLAQYAQDIVGRLTDGSQDESSQPKA